jgi:hypothetical protein
VRKEDSEKVKRKNMKLFSKPKVWTFFWRGGLDLMLTVFQSNKFELSSSSLY